MNHEKYHTPVLQNLKKTPKNNKVKLNNSKLN